MFPPQQPTTLTSPKLLEDGDKNSTVVPDSRLISALCDGFSVVRTLVKEIVNENDAANEVLSEKVRTLEAENNQLRDSIRQLQFDYKKLKESFPEYAIPDHLWEQLLAL